jgi:predicted CXXCH cytochrome family protein
MKKLWHCLRGSPLYLLAAVVIVAVGIGPLGTVWSAPVDQPRGEDPQPLPRDPDYKSCGECHVDIHAAWASGVHAIAYDRPSFQQAWHDMNQERECLSCHVTGYQPATTRYWQENIQCEACHGLTPDNHPEEPFVLTRSADKCGDCHTLTFDEWEHSLHAFTPDMGAIGCATCHNPHGQQIRLDGDINQLCLNCHQADTTSYVHLTHNEVDIEGVDVTCASCHMYQREPDELHKLSDHTMYVGTVSCTDCHQEISLTGASPILIDVDAALAEERNILRMQVDELQTRLAQLEEEESTGIDFIRLTQGLIIGLGLGITVLWVLMRRGNGESAGDV